MSSTYDYGQVPLYDYGQLPPYDYGQVPVQRHTLANGSGQMPAHYQTPAYGAARNEAYGQVYGQTPATGTGQSSYTIDRRVLDVYAGLVNTLLQLRTVARSTVSVRHAFLRKVYGILSAQLVLTIAVAVCFLTFKPLEAFIKSNQWILWVCFVASLGLIAALHTNSRQYPTNMQLLAAFTLCEAINIGVIVTFYSVASVVQALFLTCAAVVALTIYTFQSRKDFSSWQLSLFAALCILLAASIMQIFLQNDLFELVIAVTGSILFSLYIIYDTHQIMEKVSPEEYINAALDLYLDIINLFISILRLMGKRDD